MGLGAYIRLLRVRQWYKNLLVFLALFFAGVAGSLDKVLLAVLGFIVLSLTSSLNYILNDIVDIRRDRRHPEKRYRPLASGEIRKAHAVLLACALFWIIAGISVFLNEQFRWLLLVLFLGFQVYNVYFKDILFLDIISIGTFFVMRAILGAVLIDVRVSPWLILCPFFLSMLLSSGKRYGDLLLLEENAQGTRKVLKEYTISLANTVMIMGSVMFLISYALYSFSSVHPELIYTIPFAMFVVLRYFYIVHSGSEIARHPEKGYTDIQLVVSVFCWVVAAFGLVYY